LLASDESLICQLVDSTIALLYCSCCTDGEEKLVLKLAGRSPHTIQLCEDMTPLSPSSALSQLCISLSPKRAVKSRRR